MKKSTISTIFCFLSVCGYGQVPVGYPSPSNMRIELFPGNPGKYSPIDPPGVLSYAYDIEAYISRFTQNGDIHILNINGNYFFNFHVIQYTPSLYTIPPRYYGRFFFEGVSDIGIDTGIILNTGVAYYTWAVLPAGAISQGPSEYPGVVWPATYNSSGYNLGFDVNDFQVPRFNELDRTHQYPELVAMNNGDSVFDANVLDVDFVPKGPSFKLQYVFGSEEYGQACGYPTDVMGIFLSGPGINGQQNIAVLPGTSTPVNPMTVYPAHSACRGEDTSASPYYVDNTGGQNIIYDGFTKVMTAYASVTPCDTYHLRIAVADGGVHPYDTLWIAYGNPGHAFDSTNNSFWDTRKGRTLYDSGIMLKDHSFRSTDSLWLEALGGSDHSAEHPYAVRGCLNGSIRLNAATPWPIDRTFHLNYGGNAQVTVDYAPISNTVVIPANDTFVDIPVTVLWGGSGTKALKVGLLSPYGACYQMNGNYLDSTTLFIGDGYVARIEPRDTSICTGCGFQFHVMGEDFLQYSWAPATGLSNPNIKNPVASPQANTQYTLTVTANAQHPCPGNKDSSWVYVGATGIGETANGRTFSVAPNPFHDNFQIQLKAQNGETFRLAMYNILGQKVYEVKGNIGALNNHIKSVGNDLNPGTYFIELKSDNGPIFRKEMVKW